ncbi:MAG TPA: HAD-IA family hydrolase, partial [Alkalispirochaeta sp.]|nr:HAD-IA family hydrolase [Alkalispirochaeta sp.]
RNYEHILIDADNTILDFAVCERRILETMAREFGFMPWTVEGEDLTTAYRRINVALWHDLEQGDIQPDELKIERFRRLIDLLDFTALSRPVAPEFLNMQFIMRLKQCPDVVPTAAPVVASLAPVVVVTNGFADVQRPRLEGSGLLPHISHVFISEEIGAAKPQRAFFDHVVQTLGNPDPSRCLVVGDSLSSDIAGGNAAGMDTVWFDRSEMLGESSPVPGGGQTPTYRITRLVELREIVGIN